MHVVEILHLVMQDMRRRHKKWQKGCHELRGLRPALHHSLRPATTASSTPEPLRPPQYFWWTGGRKAWP